MRIPSTTARALSLLAVLLAAATPPAIAQSRDAEIEALREQIRALDQKLRVLERRQELKDEEAAARSRSSAVLSAGPGGFSLTSGDKAFQLRLRALVQGDARFFINDIVPGNDTFLFRRVRPTLEGAVFEKFGFRITPEFAGSSASLIDAYSTYQHSPAFNLLVGKSKTPFDLERLVSGGSLLFLERAYPSSLAGNRDLGVQVHGDLFDGRLSYQLGWLNGVPDGGSSTSDSEDDKDLVARLFAQPFKNSGGPWRTWASASRPAPRPAAAERLRATARMPSRRSLAGVVASGIRATTPGSSRRSRIIRVPSGCSARGYRHARSWASEPSSANSTLPPGSSPRATC